MMAKEQELMALMAGAGAPAGEPAPGGATALPGEEAPAPPSPPMASPMGTPEPKSGQKEAAPHDVIEVARKN